jgi:hypothetical protein
MRSQPRKSVIVAILLAPTLTLMPVARHHRWAEYPCGPTDQIEYGAAFSEATFVAVQSNRFSAVMELSHWTAPHGYEAQLSPCATDRNCHERLKVHGFGRTMRRWRVRPSPCQRHNRSPACVTLRPWNARANRSSPPGFLFLIVASLFDLNGAGY